MSNITPSDGRRMNRRIVHLHIPKTAGTAISSAFQVYFGRKDRICLIPNDRKFTSINPHDFDFFSGHFSYASAVKMDGDIICLFRHPVDRFISIYYFWRKLHLLGVEKSPGTQAAAKFSLDEFVYINDLPWMIEQFSNQATWQVTFGTFIDQRSPFRLAGNTDEDLLRTAVANVQTFACIGLQENVRPFTRQLRNKYGVDLDLKEINVTGDRSSVTDVSYRTRRRIQEWVAADLELYEFVRSLCNNRRAEDELDRDADRAPAAAGVTVNV